MAAVCLLFNPYLFIFLIQILKSTLIKPHINTFNMMFKREFLEYIFCRWTITITHMLAIKQFKILLQVQNKYVCTESKNSSDYIYRRIRCYIDTGLVYLCLCNVNFKEVIKFIKTVILMLYKMYCLVEGRGWQSLPFLFIDCFINFSNCNNNDNRFSSVKQGTKIMPPPPFFQLTWPKGPVELLSSLCVRRRPRL